MSRALAREDAFKIIFEMELTNIFAGDALSYLYDTVEKENEMWAQSFISLQNKKYLEEVVNGISEKHDELIENIEPLLKGWKINRISKVNLAILELAIYEINFMNDIPYKVSASEAVNLAKKYGGDESSSFINGVIGTLLKQKACEEN